MKKIILSLGIIIVTVAIAFVGVSLAKGKTYKVQNPIATIQVEGYEKPIKIELDPQSAPNAVANFIKLSERGYYTNFKMSIESNRLLGSEDMEKAKVSNLRDNPESDYVYGIKGDFIANGTDNLIKHESGVITMERDDYSYFGYTEEGYNSANSNFCILTDDIKNYNGYYAGFGKVVEGMDVLKAIAATRVENDSENTSENSENTDVNSEENKDKNVITISNISIDTYGVDYGLPETVNYEKNYEKVEKAYQQYFGGNSTVTTDSDGNAVVSTGE